MILPILAIVGTVAFVAYLVRSRKGSDAMSNRAGDVLRAALADLGVSEQPVGSNDGPRLREMSAALPNTGWAPGAAWCAIAASDWIRTGAPGLIKGSAMAKEVGSQLKAAGVPWFDRGGILANARPGSVVVWDRGVKGAEWRGHIGIVESVDMANGELHTVEGNSGADYSHVARMIRKVSDPQLLGVAVL